MIILIFVNKQNLLVHPSNRSQLITFISHGKTFCLFFSNLKSRFSRTSNIDISLIYHREARQQSANHTQSFVLCDIEEGTKRLRQNKILFESHRGGF
jgi:hypothetical protein